MKAGIKCGFENVTDEVCVAAFEALSIQPWIAAGNVEMIKFCREGNTEKYGAGDFHTLTGVAPNRFGTFVKDSLRPLLNTAK